MPHSRTRCPAVPDLRRGQTTWRGRPGSTLPKQALFSGRDGLPPYLPRDRLGIPGPPRVFADRSYSCGEAGLPIRLLPADRSQPVRQVRADHWGTRRDGTPSVGSLTRPECSSACGWDGVAGLSQPSPPGIAGGVHGTRHCGTGHPGCARRGRGRARAVRAVVTLMARFRPNPTSPEGSWVCRGREAMSPAINPRFPGGHGVRPGTRTGSPPDSIAGQAGEADGGTRQGELPWIPRRLPD